MDLEIMKADKAAARRPAIRSAKVELEILLEQHNDWVQSGGRTGRQADLSRLNLEGADLTDTNLQKALLNETALQGADLLLTDLQGASLLQANLQGANLLGARLREANLQGATLEGATGLLAAELAGTNLTFAKLPAEVATAEDLKYVARRGRHANWLIGALLLLNALACWRVITVSDAQILRNAALLPFPVLRTNVPLVEFFLLCPLVIGALYLWLHVYLQRFWEATAALPAIFETGRRLDKCLPWMVSWPVTSYFKWLREKRSALAGVEKAICILLLYWFAPATMTLFWARYLTLQDLRGTMLHAALVAAVTTAAIHFPRSVARAFRSEDSRSFSAHQAEAPQSMPAPADDPLASVMAPKTSPARSESKPRSFWRKANRSLRLSMAGGFAFVLCLLSIGTIGGAPHGGNSAQGIGSGSPWTWAADALWLVGYDPYPHVAEAEISRKPAGWTGSDAEVSRVQGATLNGFRLRYLQAYSAFLVKARLRQADLRYASLTEADLRQANLRQASLRFAALDQAKLGGAMLQSADLEKANLIRAELEKADLSFASMAGAVLLDAKLDGAVLYGADLRNTWLERAGFEQADLRQANLEGANLKMSDLRGAYLSTAKMAGARLEEAQLGSAILMGADLRHADLSNSNIQGAVLSSADLSGANLQNADLRGVVGLSVGQICAAANARQAQLDDALATEVGARCSANR